VQRFAIVGTPRSGNMWLRRLLVSLLELSELSADTPGTVPWQQLPERCVLQLHWHPDAALLELLEKHSLTPVVLARHPLDVLISILHFAQHEPRTSRWLNGAGGTERSLVGASPCSPAFLEYATGERAHLLLSLTVEWSHAPQLGALVRYERLVDDAQAELRRLADELALAPVAPLESVVERNRFESLRAQVANEHFWHGTPYLWRRLLPASVTAAIVDAHRGLVDDLGYDVLPDPELDERSAMQSWRELARNGRAERTVAPTRLDPGLESYLELAAVPDAELVDQLYRRVLRRPPDEEARAVTLAKLAEGTLSRASLLHDLASSPEASRVRLLDDRVAFARWARSMGERPRLLEAPPESDESAIAIPWALARYRGQARVLDVGYAFAEPGYLAALIEATPGEPTGLDLAMKSVPGLRSVQADVRRLPFADEAFDVVFCLSTLQHVGYDNRVYGLDVEHDPGGALEALRELRRILARTGRLLVTVPCGEPRDYGWFFQHDADGWCRMFERADFFVFEKEVYERRPDGWRSQPDFDPTGVRYAERGPGASAVLCVDLRPGRLRKRARQVISQTRARLSGTEYRPG
jgi:SAM-dependent methyltransferase